MPVQECTTEGRHGRRWGKGGKCYACDGNDCAKAHRQAEAQGKAIGENSATPSRFASPPKVETYRSGDAKQARAPKGAPGGIGGEWIDTVRGILAGLGGKGEAGHKAGPLVETHEPLPRLFGDHSPIEPTDTDKNGKPFGADVAEAANRCYQKNAECEPVVTRDITGALGEVGMKPDGLDFRLKTPESLARKIRDDIPAKGTVDAAAAGMFDVIRYTGVAPAETYAQASQGALDELRRRGYQTVKVKNFWQDSTNPYNGINTQVIGPKGEQVELQFHTPESKVAALTMHPMFEDYRLMPDKTDSKAVQLWEDMHAIGKAVPKPPGVEVVA